MAETDVRRHFREMIVNGVAKAVCTICHKAVARNAGVMRGHYMWAHQRQSEPSNTAVQKGGGDETECTSCEWKNWCAGNPDGCLHTQGLASSSRLSGAQERAKKVSKRTLKFLAVCTDPVVYTTVMRRATPGLVKTLCNAAINVATNPDILLSEAEKTVLGRHRKRVYELMSEDIPVRSKRKMLLKPARHCAQSPESASYVPLIASIVDDHGMVEDLACCGDERCSLDDDTSASETDSSVDEQSSTDTEGSDNSEDDEEGSAYSDDELEDSRGDSDSEYSNTVGTESEDGGSANNQDESESSVGGWGSASDEGSTTEEESVDESDAETSRSESTQGGTDDSESADTADDEGSDAVSDDGAGGGSTANEESDDGLERRSGKHMKPMTLKDRVIAYYKAQGLDIDR
jgi:hypothetical protein